MSEILQTPNNYSSLSVKDLLQARELYHFHLINKANVVGTAVGRYLIRKGDPYPKEKGDTSKSRAAATDRHKPARTFENSEVRSYSWPCVLVLVKKWADMNEFGSSDGQIHPDQMVPRTLYMPDGRTVPVCVVCVEQTQQDRALLPDWHWPSGTFGGGMPIVVESQGRNLYATVGCLVSDGQHVYALTSGHVCGDKGGAVYTVARGERVLIGYATGERLTREQFQTLYPEFPGQRSFSRMDVGLIRLSNAEDWTSQTFGLKAPGPLADLNEWNISTRLIGAPVVAVGAASGRLEGRICALFYRYKTLGAYDYIADFLIAPNEVLPRKNPHPAGRLRGGVAPCHAGRRRPCRGGRGFEKE